MMNTLTRTIVTGWLFSFMAASLAMANDNTEEQPEWLYVTFENGDDFSYDLRQETQLIGFAQQLNDEHLLESVRIELALETLPESFIIFQQSDGSYMVEPISTIASIVLDTAEYRYQQHHLTGQLMLLGRTFIENTFADSHPEIIHYTQSKKPLMLGLDPNAQEDSSQQEGPTPQEFMAGHRFDGGSNSAVGGSGECSPICRGIFNNTNQ